MAAIFSTLFRGLVHVGITTLVVALTWTIYIYRAPIASTIEPVIRQFQSTPTALEPARAAATVPAPEITPVVPTQAEGTSNPAPVSNTTVD